MNVVVFWLAFLVLLHKSLKVIIYEAIDEMWANHQPLWCNTINIFPHITFVIFCIVSVEQFLMCSQNFSQNPWPFNLVIKKNWSSSSNEFHNYIKIKGDTIYYLIKECCVPWLLQKVKLSFYIFGNFS